MEFLFLHGRIATRNDFASRVSGRMLCLYCFRGRMLCSSCPLLSHFFRLTHLDSHVSSQISSGLGTSCFALCLARVSNSSTIYLPGFGWMPLLLSLVPLRLHLPRVFHSPELSWKARHSQFLGGASKTLPCQADAHTHTHTQGLK